MTLDFLNKLGIRRGVSQCVWYVFAFLHLNMQTQLMVPEYLKVEQEAESAASCPSSVEPAHSLDSGHRQPP